MAMVFDGGGSASYQHLIEDFAMRAQRQTAMLIQHGIDIGFYRTDLNLEVVAAFIAGGYDRIARQMVREQRKPDIEAMLREVQSSFLRGIARHEALDSLNLDRQKLSEKQGVERGEGYVQNA
jgi:hypothetical protein